MLMLGNNKLSLLQFSESMNSSGTISLPDEDCFTGRDDNGCVHDFRWHRSWSRVTKKASGVTGWATVVRSGGPATDENGGPIRVHLCAHSPCIARWPPGKYGAFPVPLHVQAAKKEEFASEQLPTPGPLVAYTHSAAVVDNGTAGDVAVAGVDVAVAIVDPAVAGEHDTDIDSDSTVIDHLALDIVQEAPCLSAWTVAPFHTSEELATVVAENEGAQLTEPACIEHPDAPTGIPLTSSEAAPPNFAVADKSGSYLKVLAVPHAAQQEKRLYQILQLARDIRRPCTFVGQVFFVVLGLIHKWRPILWEGAQRVDLLQTIAPWADHCTGPGVCEGVCCCLKAEEGGAAVFCPVSDETPLNMCRHFIACTRLDAALETGGTSIQAFYNRLGIVLLGTVCDGDCGPDFACMALGFPQTVLERAKLRESVSDYIADRANVGWMQEILVLCQEIPMDDLINMPSGSSDVEMSVAPPVEASAPQLRSGDIASDVEMSVAPPVEASAPQLRSGDIAKPVSVLADQPADELKHKIKALQWVTKIENVGSLKDLVLNLPDWTVNEQVVRYEQHLRKPQESTVVEHPKIVFEWREAVSRARVCERLEQRIQESGRNADARIPRGFIAEFLESNVEFKRKPPRDLAKKLSSYYIQWKKLDKPHFASHSKSKQVMRRGSDRVKNCKLKRFRNNQGPLVKMQWVRQELYEWFVSVRYSFDYKTYWSNRGRSSGRKCLARFPKAVLLLKLRELTMQYIEQRLIHGQPAAVVATDWRWFKRFEEDYGITFLNVNRKYKIPKALLYARLKCFWLFIFRLRKLAVLVLGYDLEFENFDQSPYHHNEVGSQGGKTAALVNSGEVPVIEGHADTRARWSGNFTTFSDKARIMDGDLPYVECMFKAEGEQLLQQLKEHCRSCGIPRWLSVATSPKGSYREADVINFLERHLPAASETRRWRVMLSDDFGPHKSENVAQLCWNRQYLSAQHPGGATPVTQTPDTHLNQYVRQDYTDKESAELLRQMQAGRTVPRMNATQCIDTMLEVFSNRELHLHASDGYKETGTTVALDGSEDFRIVKEAGKAWRELDMRPLLDKAMEDVEAEVSAGRLSWCREDIAKLITPYPRSKCDEVLENLGDDYFLDNEDVPYVQEDEAAVAAEASDPEELLSNDEHEEPGNTSAVMETPDAPASKDRDLDAISLSSVEANRLHAEEDQLSIMRRARDELKNCGAIKGVLDLDNEMRKIQRRQRQRGLENPAVAGALLRLQDAEAAEKRKREALVRAEHQKERAAAAIKKQLADAKLELKRKRNELLDMESLLECRAAVKRYTPEMLGQMSTKAAKTQSRKLRLEILDRLARLGTGLSAAQRNDWEWFKDAWDEKMLAEHAANWGTLLLEWTNAVLRAFENGEASAFSVFVYNETVRCFSAVPMLAIPGS